jgi:hypothetical protein
MTRRARFTQSELDRLFGAAKKNGLRVRIVSTRDSITIETLEAEQEITTTPRGLRVLEGKDIIL